MKLINYDEVQRKLGGTNGPSRRTIERMVERGEFVAPVQAAPRRLMFVESEVDAWIAARKKLKQGKRDPMDYDRNDVDLYVAKIHGYTLDQIMSLDFPGADYTDISDTEFWTFDTVFAWLGRFHTAIHLMNRAAAPEDFERFIEMLRRLMREKTRPAE